MKLRSRVIRDVSVRPSRQRPSQQASKDNTDHGSQQEVGQSSTVNSSNAPNAVVPLVVRATRGPSKYSDIWNLPENQKIELPLTSNNQPVMKDLALKNKNSRSKQKNLHTGGSKIFASYSEEMVTTLGHLVERAELYLKLHLRKDGAPVNPEAERNVEKINELLSELSNRLQSTDLIGSIAWAPDNIYSQVFGNECNGRVWGVGFGPTPSGRTVKNTAAIAQIRSQDRDAEVPQLKSQVALLTEKITRYTNLEERITQMASMMQLMQNHYSEVGWGGFALDQQSPSSRGSQASSHQETSFSR